jgi:phage terminase large subunit-like protein
MNRYVNKKKSNAKVDMVVSLINAMYLLQQDRLMNYSGFVAQVI